MHQEAITALLMFRSDDLDAQLIVSGSEAPCPSLAFSRLSADKKHLDVLARGKQSVVDNGGISHLAQNPLTLEMIASASSQGGDLQLWKFNPATWQQEELADNTLKRQKTGVLTAQPFGQIKNVTGVSSMHWSTADSIVCGGVDH
jgi:hypothetical protein